MKRIVVLILRQTHYASGLKMDVARNYHGIWFPDVVAAGETLSLAFATGEIKFPSGTTIFLISRREQEFQRGGVANLTMAVAGTYNLFITSDDGSRLFVDRVLVIESGRIYGITEKTGALDLKVGPEAIVLDCHHGWGPSGMMIVERGPDLNIVTEVVPSTASSSEMNEEGQFNCEILAVKMVRLRTVRAQGISSLLASGEEKDEDIFLEPFWLMVASSSRRQVGRLIRWETATAGFRGK